MFLNQTAGFGPEFEYRKGRSIVDKDRSSLQVLDAGGELRPFVGRKTSAFHLVAGNLASVLQQTVHQLQVTHFETEHTYMDAVVDGHILYHRERKGCLAHCRTCSNNDKVAVLPSRGDLVELGVASA